MSDAGILAVSWLAGFVFLCVVFGYGFLKKRYDIIDSAWGMTFIVMGLTSFVLSEKTTVGLLLTSMVVVWGLRLSWHIFMRFLASQAEDQRYVELRKKWRGSVAVNTFLRIYIVQAVLAFLVSLPVLLANLNTDNDTSLLIFVGLAVWVFGYSFEIVSDKQLKDFVTNPKNKGKIMTEGLWRYSRHPNYFGEITLWWGIFIMSFVATGLWWAVIGPITITLLILFVSGIPPSEKRFAGRPGWEEYKDKTSVLIPLPKSTRS